MESVDLAVLQCIRRKQTDAERNPARARSRSRTSARGKRELTVVDMAVELVRSELYLRAQGRSVCAGRTPPWLAERRATSAGLRRWHVDDVESALIWLCVRGLAECIDDEAYRWTGNATDERLRRLLA